MLLYTAIHNHRFGQTVYNFRTEEEFPVSLMDGQLERLATLLSIEYDAEDDSLYVVQESEDEFTILSIAQMEYVLTGKEDDHAG